MNETINKKLNKKTLIALLGVVGLGLTGMGFGIGYAVKPPKIVDKVVVGEPEQPFWALLISGSSHGGTFTINKNDITNIQIIDTKTLLFDYKIGKKTLRYDVNTRNYGGIFQNWQTPLQVFLNKDNTDNIFDLNKYDEGTFKIRIEKTEI